MLRNYLIVAIRSLLRHRMQTAISVCSLGVGITFCLFAFVYIHNEATYDSFHRDSHRIFRVHSVYSSPEGGERRLAAARDPLGAALREEHPQLAVVRMNRRDRWLRVGGRFYKEEICFADPAVLEVFGFPLEAGRRGAALEQPNSIVLSRDLAVKYFGEEDPIGKTLTLILEEECELVVTGVLGRIPPNTSIDFDLLVPFSVLYRIEPDFERKWHSTGTHTYVRCPPGLAQDELDGLVQRIHDTRIPDWLRSRGHLVVQPLRDIHLGPLTQGEMVPGSSRLHLYALAAVALSILGIACVNFINLATALSAGRSQEVAMREVLGARRRQVVTQFLGEAVVTSLIALVLGIGLAELALSGFGLMGGKELTLGVYRSLWTASGLLVFAVAVGVVAGAYPAAVASVGAPSSVLVGRASRQGGSRMVRRVLVVVQFAAVAMLVVGNLVVIEQIGFMKKHPLGLNPERVVAIPTGGYADTEILSKLEVFLEEAERHRHSAGIISYCLSENVPGGHYHNKFGVIPEGVANTGGTEMIVTSVDDRFLDTYQIELVAGRGFRASAGSEEVLITETAARLSGWDDPVGKRFRYVHGEGPFTVIGVVRDAHIRSLRHPIEPVIYRSAREHHMARFVSVRIRGDGTEESLARLEEKWQAVVRKPFDYWFVDEVYEDSYEEEERVSRIIGGFGAVAIVLACIGVYGLAAASTGQRTKEIGIRKAVGATAADVVLLLSREFSSLAMMATLLAWPVVYVGCWRWLEAYPYRVDLGPEPFAIGGVLVLGVVLATVSSHAIRAAWANPVDSLRLE